MNEQVENSKSLKDYGVQITETMTTPTRPGKKPRPVWVASGNTFGLETFFRDIGGKKFRGFWSFFSDPSDEILQELNTNGRQNFAKQIESKLDRKISRIERFEGYAENASARSESAYKKAHSISSMIPLGQPILVGHHSESRHRRDLERIDSGMRKSIQESEKADHFSHKASFLDHQVSRMTESREYVGNRIKEVTARLASLEREKAIFSEPARKILIQERISQVTEKLEYWQQKICELEAKVLSDGGQVASPETVKVGDEIYYSGWLPVVRVNKKTVTVSNWLGVPHFQYKIEYSRINKFRTPKKD